MRCSRPKRARRAARKARIPTERVVFQLTDITVPDFEAGSTEGKRIEESTRRSLTEDLMAQYVTRLQTDFGATINQDALRRVASGGSDQN